MKSGAFRSKLIVQLTLVLFVNLIHAKNLDFYQDVEPDVPEEIAYKQVARYLESQSHKPRIGGLQRGRLIPNLPWPYAEYHDYDREKEKLLETLLENRAIYDVLENEKLKNRDDPENWRRDIYEFGPGYRRQYLNENPTSSRMKIYENINPLDDYEEKKIFTPEKNNYRENSEIRENSRSQNFPEIDNFSPRENNLDEAEKLLKIRENILNSNSDRMKNENIKSIDIGDNDEEFTFKFDPPKFNERETFAIRPNDPRYYEDEISSTADDFFSRDTTTAKAQVFQTRKDDNLSPFHEILGNDDNFGNDFSSDINRNVVRDKFSLMKVILPDRRTERDPLLVSSTRMSNNDIYFIAIVAGCSAAAMFALVLIALTWCRLHRGAKAAADIEYPAYGVTGPNKDISPSGDQRLAHSAQMYHFQHQKQQIIAMENRTASSRDPGSVSEAESDEENEEGDYTVYECPGLASTGEMEVKNPMFHDDPTPATPPQIHKEEDHNM